MQKQYLTVRVLFVAMFLTFVHFFIMVSLQNTSVSPDGKLVSVLGDSAECLIADAQSGKVSHSFWLFLACFFICM